MHKLISGIHQFQSTVFRSNRDFYENLVHGQEPEALMITCCDSRINPNQMTSTAPGELLILRNAGNIIPPYSPEARNGEQGTIEFAIEGLGVKNIIVCGHSHCGAIKALLNVETMARMESLRNWLEFANAGKLNLDERYPGLSDDDKLNVATQENVLLQLVNLRSHPTVAKALDSGKIKLHGWVYKFETGQVFAFDPTAGQFNCVNTLQPEADRQPIDMVRLERFSA